MLKRLSLILISTLAVTGAWGQSAPPLRDPDAVALANRALQALAGGTVLTDITLQGSVIYSAESGQQTGTATLLARGNMQSFLTLNLRTANAWKFAMAREAYGWIPASPRTPWPRTTVT